MLFYTIQQKNLMYTIHWENFILHSPLREFTRSIKRVLLLTIPWKTSIYSVLGCCCVLWMIHKNLQTQGEGLQGSFHSISTIYKCYMIFFHPRYFKRISQRRPIKISHTEPNPPIECYAKDFQNVFSFGDLLNTLLSLLCAEGAYCSSPGEVQAWRTHSNKVLLEVHLKCMLNILSKEEKKIKYFLGRESKT